VVAAIAAASVVVAGVGAALVLADEPADVSAGDPASSTTSTEPPIYDACGTELPFELPLPDGFTGPEPGLVVPPAYDPPADGSYAAHWSRGGTDVDVRWPSSPPLDPTTPHESDTPSVWLSCGPVPLEDGRLTANLNYSTSRLGELSCASMDVTVVAPDAATLDATIVEVRTALEAASGPFGVADEVLVVESLAMDELPEGIGCSPPAGEDGSGVQGGPVDLPTYATAREALRAFLVTQPTLQTHQWTEVTLPDGTMGYLTDVALPEEEPTWATRIHVVPDGDGWTIVDWQSPTC
jgi:hypothetical protein